MCGVLGRGEGGREGEERPRGCDYTSLP